MVVDILEVGLYIRNLESGLREMGFTPLSEPFGMSTGFKPLDYRLTV